MRISPATLFTIVWVIPLSAPLFLDAEVVQPISARTQWLVMGSIAFFFLLQFASRVAVGAPRRNLGVFLCDRIERDDFERKTLGLLKIWLAVYIVNIVGSGGLPIIWTLTGDVRTYANFGLPTLGGLGNMLRAFILANCYLICFELGSPRRKLFVAIGLSLVFSAFILETGRGNGVVLLLHPLGMFVLLRRIKFADIVVGALLGLLLAMFLGYLQALRYGAGLEHLAVYAENSGYDTNQLFALLLLPALLYISVPIINTDLNVTQLPTLQFEPYYSFAGLVPTVFREVIFEPRDYGELVNESHNVSSFFIPFVRDFGTLGAFIVVAAIHAGVSIIYAKARRGSLLAIFTWPAIFMSVTLSFFSLFYTSLVVLTYPLLAIWFIGAVSRDSRRAAPGTSP